MTSDRNTRYTYTCENCDIFFAVLLLLKFHVSSVNNSLYFLGPVIVRSIEEHDDESVLSHRHPLHL